GPEVGKVHPHRARRKVTAGPRGTNWTVKMLERIQRGEATPMDLDIMASVQDHIIGNCLCVLGDSMAMPIGSMIVKFRAEFEAHMERARQERGIGEQPEPPALIGVTGDEPRPQPA